MQWVGVLIVLNTFVLCLCSLPAVLTDPMPHSFSTWNFYIVCFIAQNFLFSSLFAFILLPFLFIVRSLKIKIFLILLSVASVQMLCFTNAKIFAFWRLYLNDTLLHLYFYGGSKVLEISNSLYFSIIGIIALVCIISVLTVWLANRFQKHIQWSYWIGFFVLIYILAQSLFLLFCRQDDMRFLQYTLKIPYFYNFSWVNAVQTMHPVFPKKSLTTQFQIALSEKKKLQYPLRPLQYSVVQKPLNVLLIVVDTLRYDMINSINMPNVYQFSLHANQFLDNLSGGDCTRPGIFSLFYSIPPNYWDAAKHTTGSAILIQAFQHNHYRLGIFASAPLYSPAFNETIFSTVKNLQLETKGEAPLDRDTTITKEAQHFLNQASSIHHPFFAFVFYDAPHAYNALTLEKPFYPVGYLNYFNVNNNTSSLPMFNLYKNAVFADDQLIKNIFSTLKQDHLNHNTIVIITADHGQEFNEYHNNYWEHASGFSKYQIRTPMIIAWPGRKNKLFYYQTSHYDLTPTLLQHALGVTNRVSDYSVGNDLLSKKQADFVMAGNYGYFALISTNKIIQFHDSGLYRVTDLKMQSLSIHTVPKTKINNTIALLFRYSGQ